MSNLLCREKEAGNYVRWLLYMSKRKILKWKWKFNTSTLPFVAKDM